MLTVTTPRHRVQLGVNFVASYWLAAYNPLVFTWGRQDAQVQSITGFLTGGVTEVRVTISGSDFSDIDPTGKFVYLNSGQYVGVFKVLFSFDNGTTTIIRIDTDFIGASTGGYINNLARENYRIQFTITIFKQGIYPIKTVTISQSVKKDGTTELDVAPVLQDTLIPILDQDSTDINAPDFNLFGFFQIGRVELWDDQVSTSFANLAQRWFFTYSANQYGNEFGSNLFEFVPFLGSSNSGLTEPDLSKKGKFLTKFTNPKYWNGWPFKLMFIYSEFMNGSDLQRRETTRDINDNTITPLNEDLTTNGEESLNYLNIEGDYIASVGSVQVCIYVKQTIDDLINLPAQPVDLPPVKPVHGFPGNVTINNNVESKRVIRRYFDDDYYDTNGYYTQKSFTANSLAVIECINLQVVQDCVPNPFYLVWANTLGGFDYYMFEYNQVDRIKTKTRQQYEPWQANLAVAERGVFDLANISSQLFRLGGRNIPSADLDGLKDLFASPVVYRVEQDGTKHRVLVKKGGMTMYETEKGFNDISFELLFPEINLQLG